MTFSFSEAPTDFTAANITATGGTLGTLTAVNATDLHRDLHGGAGTDISNAAVSVDNTWHEDNGNPGTGASTSFTVDTVTPTAAVDDRPQRRQPRRQYRAGDLQLQRDADRFHRRQHHRRRAARSAP